MSRTPGQRESAQTFPKAKLGVIWEVHRTMDPPNLAVAPEMMVPIEWINAKREARMLQGLVYGYDEAAIRMTTLLPKMASSSP